MAQAISVVEGNKKNDSEINGVPGQAIPDVELATTEQARDLITELGPNTFSFDLWEPDSNSKQTIVYAGDAMILRLQPGNQSIGQLLAAQKANPVGSWDVSNPYKVQWVPSMNKDLNTAGVSDTGFGDALNKTAANSLSQQQKVDEIYRILKTVYPGV